jgi:hypothetical protein
VRAACRRALRIVAVAAATAVVAGCGSPRGLYWPLFPPDLPPPRVVGEAANGSTVDIVRTQWLLVRLPAERDGPNRWTYDLGKDRILYPSGDTPRSPGPGESDPDPDSAVYTFRAEGTGTTSVRFVYRNPEQPQSPPAKVVAFDVVAR